MAVLNHALDGAGTADGRSLEELRAAARASFESLEMPTWRRSGFWTTTFRALDAESLTPVPAADDSIPEVVSDALGDQRLAGLLVQRGATVVHTELDPELAA